MSRYAEGDDYERGFERGLRDRPEDFDHALAARDDDLGRGYRDGVGTQVQWLDEEESSRRDDPPPWHDPGHEPERVSTVSAIDDPVALARSLARALDRDARVEMAGTRIGVEILDRGRAGGYAVELYRRRIGGKDVVRRAAYLERIGDRVKAVAVAVEAALVACGVGRDEAARAVLAAGAPPTGASPRVHADRWTPPGTRRNAR